MKTCSLCLRIESEGWTCEGCADQARSVGAPPKFVCAGCVNSKRLKWAGELTEDGSLCVLCVESREEKRAELFAGVYAREHTPEVIGRLSAKICPWLLVFASAGTAELKLALKRLKRVGPPAGDVLEALGS